MPSHGRCEGRLGRVSRAMAMAGSTWNDIPTANVRSVGVFHGSV
jgi:hypothetical protein